MRRLIYLVILLLTLALTPQSQTQVRVVSTTARVKNEARYNQATDSLNVEIGNLNALNNSFQTVWQVRPEKRLEILQRMRAKIDEMESLNLHYDEEP
ncbi:MAG: hypothetical protein ACLGJB_17890 [Blastocatellia bacterium]